MYPSGTGHKSITLKYIHKSKKKKVLEYAIDETVLKVGPEYVWLWVAVEVESREILGISISKERNMFVAERFISSLIKHYDRHPISTDGGTWYPQACRFLKIHIICIPHVRKASLRGQCST